MNLWALILTSVISCTVSFVFGGLFTQLSGRIKGGAKREKAMQEGVKCLLRGKLIDYHDTYTERGYCPIYVKESARRSYEAYHALGGNGVVTKLFTDLMALPESEREENIAKN